MNKAERTRQFILQQAAPLFNTKGYAGTSLSDITATTKLTKGAIYGNFRDKDELAVAAFRHNKDSLLQGCMLLVSQQTTYTGRLQAYTAFYRQTLHEGLPVGGCPILNTAVEADDTHPQLRQEVNAVITNWHQTLIQLVISGQAAGEFDADVEPGVFADLLIALVEGGLMLVKTTGQPRFLHHTLDHIDALIQAMRTQRD